MGSHSRREYTHRVIEHTVPRTATASDLFDALRAAEREWIELNRANGSTTAVPDDWARIDADGEHIIIRLRTDEAV